jgi:mRNA interferase MazF
MANLEITRGDVIWVDFGEAEGRCKTGEHPAVVVQNNTGNRFSPMILVIPLTDPGQCKDLPVQVRLTSAETGLANKDSCAECGHIRCVDREQQILEARGVVGRIVPDAMRRIDEALRISLGL